MDDFLWIVSLVALTALVLTLLFVGLCAWAALKYGRRYQREHLQIEWPPRPRDADSRALR
jgi:hypothetical protein